jgi:hypothetical protein
MTGYVRTREVDTLRLVCPWQWMKCGWDFRNRPKGKYLGTVNTNWSGEGECLPHDETLYIRWKTRAGDVAVAEWNWTFTFPASKYLKGLWWDPFIMFEKEVTW